MPQASLTSWTKVTRSYVTAEAVQAVRATKAYVEVMAAQALKHYALTEMLAGTLVDQGVFTTQQAAINAALALGYPAEDVTTWWFHTFIEIDGTNEAAVAWMWKVPPEVTTRECGGTTGVGSKYPIPHKWYVQGG